MDIKVIFGILLAGILSNNYALLEFLGTGAVIENERSSKRSLLLGLGTTIVMVISSAITWCVNTYLLKDFEYFQTMAFVIIVLAVVELFHVVATKAFDSYCKADFVKFAINGAVLGLCIHNAEHDLLTAVVTAAAVGIGFMLSMTLFAKLSSRIDEEAIPASFRGLPIALLTAGMIVLAILSLQFKF